MGRAFTTRAVFDNHSSSVEVWIEHQDGGQSQVRTLHWTVPAGKTMHAIIRDEGALVLDETVIGPSSDNMNVPGSYRMREVTDENGTYLDLPAGITYSVEVQG